MNEFFYYIHLQKDICYNSKLKGELRIKLLEFLFVLHERHLIKRKRILYFSSAFTATNVHKKQKQFEQMVL